MGYLLLLDEYQSMRFELIDNVLEQGSDRVVALKNVTMAEEYLADHFPGFPVLPGVLMLEALVQAGRSLLEGRGIKDRPLVLAQASNVRYGTMVRPGQCLNIEVTLQNTLPGENGYKLKGIGRVDDQTAIQARFILWPLTPPIDRQAGEPTT